MINGIDSAIMHALNDKNNAWTAEAYLNLGESHDTFPVNGLFFAGIDLNRFSAPSWEFDGDNRVDYFPIRLVTASSGSVKGWKTGPANLEKNLPDGIIAQEAVNIEGSIHPVGTSVVVEGISDTLVPQQILIHRLTTGWFNKTIDDLKKAYNTNYYLNMRPIDRLFFDEYHAAVDKDFNTNDFIPPMPDDII